MADYQGFLRAFRERTVPDATRLERLRAGLGARRRSRALYLIAPIVLAAAAALALALRAPTAERAPAAPVPLDAPGPVALSEIVRADVDGEGLVRRDADAIDVTWRRGTLAMDVTPNRGARVTVTTDEGTVRVVGTSFTVTRDALGTTIAVTRGKVETDCAFGGPAALGAGASRTCLPRTAIGALGRIHALQDRGAVPAALLAEVETAAGRPDAGGAVANELAAVRVGALLALDRRDDALAAAEDALRHAPGARDPELRRVAARLHASAGDCAAALPHLRALTAADALGPDASLLTRCSAEAP